MAKTAAPAKSPTKSEIVAFMSDSAGITKKQAGEALAALGEIMGKSVKQGAPFVVPGLMKVKVVVKPATKARKGVNPFTKEEQVFKAKPARKVVKVLPLKGLKDMA